MAEKKLPMQFDVPGEITGSRPWLGETGTAGQCLLAVRREGITAEDFVDAFYNGTNQTMIFRK